MERFMIGFHIYLRVKFYVSCDVVERFKFRGFANQVLIHEMILSYMFFSGSIMKVKYKTTLRGNSFLPSGKGVDKSQ